MGSLIDDIFLQTKLGYISDMRFSKNIEEVLQAIHKIPKEAYTQEEWQEAYFYLIGRTAHGSYGKRALVAALSKRKAG